VGAFDIAVVIVAACVVVSLALLAWTLGESGVVAIRQERTRVATARQRIAALERQVHEAASQTRDTIERMDPGRRREPT
jgi:hypothetical protein